MMATYTDWAIALGIVMFAYGAIEVAAVWAFVNFITSRKGKKS